MQRVNGDHGVGRAIGQAGSGQVADDEPGPLGQPEQHRPVGRLLDGNGREVHPGSAGRRAPGPTTAQDRPGRSPGRPVSSQARGRERRPHDPAGRPRQRSTARSLVAGRGWRPARLAAGPRIRPRWRTPGRTRRPWPMAAGRRRSSGRAGPGSPILLTAVRSEIRVGLPGRQLAMQAPPAMIRRPDTDARPISGGLGPTKRTRGSPTISRTETQVEQR